MSNRTANRRQTLQSSAIAHMDPAQSLEPEIEHGLTRGPSAASEAQPLPGAESVTQLLKEGEAAYLLNLKVGTLRRWRWSGDGPPFIKLNGAVRYSEADLQAYIDAQRRVSTSEPSSTCG